MSEIQSSESTKAPWHLWVIGVLTLLWNAMGAFDYLMTQTQNEAYMSEFTPEQLEFFYNFPSWMVAFWALAVWGGVSSDPRMDDGLNYHHQDTSPILFLRVHNFWG